MLGALLYLPDATGERLAGAPVSGRTLPVRAMVAAHRYLLLGAATLRLLAPALVGAVAVVVAVGSQAYWVGCVARIRRLRRRPA